MKEFTASAVFSLCKRASERPVLSPFAQACSKWYYCSESSRLIIVVSASMVHHEDEFTALKRTGVDLIHSVESAVFWSASRYYDDDYAIIEPECYGNYRQDDVVSVSIAAHLPFHNNVCVNPYYTLHGRFLKDVYTVTPYSRPNLQALWEV